MFKNRKFVGLLISLSITVVMGSVYLLSLQLMGPSEESEEEQVVQEEKSAEGSAEVELNARSGESSKEASPNELSLEKSHDEKSQSKGEKKTAEHAEKEVLKKETVAAGEKHSEHTEKSEQGRGESPVEVAEEAGVDLSKKYRPRIIGRCKLLYERFNKMELQANQFHSFAYSFDGKSGYCADSGPQTSLKLAKEIALSDCEKNKGSAESYAPCFIYSSER